MMKNFDFSDLEFKPFTISGKVIGVQATRTFSNGYGISVIKHAYSYGGLKGYYELAVLDKNGELTYSTPITNDVLGWLTPEDVTEHGRAVQNI